MSDADLLIYMAYKHGDFSRWTINFSRAERHTFLDLAIANFFGGTLPRSTKKLAAICGMPLEEFEQQWPALKRNFKPCKGGIECPQIVELRAEALRLRAAHSKGAEMTAQKRAERRSPQSGPEPAGELALRIVSGLKDPKR